MADIGLRQDEAFLRRAFHKSLLPCVLSILSQNINILADGIIVGQRIGTDGLSAINLCVPVYLVLCIVGSFLVSGTAIQASRAIGRRQTEQSGKLYNTAVWSCVAAGLAVTAARLALCAPISALLCPDETVRPLVMEYNLVTLIGALPKILIYVPFWFLRMDGRARLVVWMMLIMGGGNVVLDLVFLYPLGMGIGGAAWASVISTAAACAFGLVCLCGRRSSFRLGMRCVPAADWRGIAAAGSPSALNNLFQTLRLLAVNSMLLAAGGSELVAAFTAVNCIFAFSLSVVDGVPQAASAMLGIYSGERDNDSAALLIRREWRTGALCCAAFAAVVILAADGIALAYGLSVPLRLAMVCLSAGMFPGLWWAAAGIYHRRHPELTRFLLLDRSLEEEGRVINFSVEGDTEDICDASRRISEFCEENDMNVRQVMRISLAIEEIMTMIVQENNPGHVSFDVRVFSLQQEMGIRISYDGREYDPFGLHAKGDMQYLGVDLIANMMRSVVYQRTFGVNTLQLLL